MLEEYDWTAFSVVCTRHHGYQDFLSVVEGLTDGSFIGWEKKSVVILNVTDDPGGARTRRLLKENEAQVRQGGGRGEREEERGGSAAVSPGAPRLTGGFPAFSFLLRLSLCPSAPLSPLSPLSLRSSFPFSSFFTSIKSLVHNKSHDFIVLIGCRGEKNFTDYPKK